MGLMILTNDGELANRLAHPRYGVEKVYRALVAGSPSREIVDKLTEGIWLSDGKARAKRARVVGTQGEATHPRAGAGRRQEPRDPPDAGQARAQGHEPDPDRDRPGGAQGITAGRASAPVASRDRPAAESRGGHRRSAAPVPGQGRIRSAVVPPAVRNGRRPSPRTPGTSPPGDRGGPRAARPSPSRGGGSPASRSRTSARPTWAWPGAFSG